MSTIKTTALLIAALASTPAGSDKPRETMTPALGEPAPAQLVERWNISVFPDGRGLPAGSGTVAEGKQIYEKKCTACHGEGGSGVSGDRLANAEMGLADEYPQKTIANFWPYATTLFDFIRRSKPFDAPGSLSNDEVYALTAYLLSLDGVIPKDAIMNRETLPKVVMPNVGGFINVWGQYPMNNGQ